MSDETINHNLGRDIDPITGNFKKDDGMNIHDAEKIYGPEVRSSQAEGQSELIDEWAERQGFLRDSDYLIVKPQNLTEVLNPEETLPHEQKAMYMAISEDKYSLFRDFFIMQYRDALETSGQGQAELGYSWGGRFYIKNAGLVVDTVPATITETGQLVVNSRHLEFKQFFQNETGAEFPSVEKINEKLRQIAARLQESNPYQEAYDKLKVMREDNTLPDEGYGQLDSLERALKFINDAANNIDVEELPNTFSGNLPEAVRHYNDITYNSDTLIDIDKIMQITGVSFPDEIRIDTLMTGQGFNGKMEDICKKFSEKIYGTPVRR